MIDAGTILEVTRNLIGATEPYGDSAIDRERTQNLDKLIYIVDELLYDVEKVACAAFWLFYEIKAHHEIERRNGR